MGGELGVVLKVLEPVKSFVFDAVIEYVRYIGSCEDNLNSLHRNLSDVCDKKGDVNKAVKDGVDRQEEITREARSWLKDIRILTEDEELSTLMYKDMETATLVIKLMGKKDLKKRLSEESEMQQLVVKVMKRLKEEIMEVSEEGMRKIREADYTKVAEVVVEVVKDTIEEFKNLIKEDKKIALIATRMLKDRDLDKLTEGDKEMEDIVREAGNVSDEESWYNHENENQEESSLLLTKLPESKNPVKEAVNKMFTPLGYLLTPLTKLMDDASFKKSVPEAEGVKLGLEVIDGLLLKRGVNDNRQQHRDRGCCCSTSVLCDYHDRYLISKAAELMAIHIQDNIISKCPSGPVTLCIRAVDLKPIPTQFLKGLDSRTKLLQQILDRLKDDQVDAVGIFGMGGTGKTTLAKEVNKRAKDLFSIKVMVEVSDAPDIVRIQGEIAESIGLRLHDVDNVAQRAIRLYNRLISEKEKKILVILDNIWRELNLDEVGIPRTCKLLLTTRERVVCRVMGVQNANICEVGVMNANESKDLFRSQVGNQVDARDYKNAVERLLNKCGGLPLAIVASANSLKDKDLPSWVKFVEDLEKPISSNVMGDYRHTYKILDTSYKFIEVDEKRIFFLLACLSPLGSSVSIESLIRYGIGLNLFQHVNKLCEAMEQACKWADELVLSSMLLEGDTKGDFKIHDIVRAFAIAFAATVEGHKFMVEAIPRWLDDETFKSYTAISLMSRNDYTRLSGVKADKLQILILKGELLPNFTNSFFKGMVNLEVLDLSDMDFRPKLPKSIRKLKKLRALCLEGCKLGDIKVVGELTNLLVLSLRGSFLDEMSGEIGKLCRLRLLDLTKCTCSKVSVIPAGIVGRLSKLEGLYMFNSEQIIFETKLDNEGTSVTDKNYGLPYLNVLEITVPQIELLPIDDQSIENLDKFRVCVQESMRSDVTLGHFYRILAFDGIDDVGGVLEKSCLKALLQKADCLLIQDSENFENLVPQLNQKGFKDLSYLNISGCSDLKCILKGGGMNDSAGFPHLQYLKLSYLDNVKMVCDSEAPLGTLSNLQTLVLLSLHMLLYVLPLDLLPRNLNKIYVESCTSLNFMFTESRGTDVIELACLKSLELVQVPNLLSLVGPEKLSNTSDDLRGQQTLFNGEVVFPSLELFKLTGCVDVVRLWRREIFNSSFQNLKEINIGSCPYLSNVGSPSVFSALVQLETLKITKCPQIYDVITLEEAEESIFSFPKLKLLELGSMINLESFYGGGSKLEFPELKRLEMHDLGNMIRFAKVENSSALFHEKIDFPRLEELHVISVNDEVTGLWNWKESSVECGTVSVNPAPMLRKLTLGSTRGLQRVPSVISKNLSSLKLTEFNKDDVLFTSSELSAKEEFMWAYSQLPKLEELSVDNSMSLEELFENEDSDGSYSLMDFCGQIKSLKLIELPELNLIPLHLFKGLGSLTLAGLRWKYVISADMLGESLEQLEYLSIDVCEKMVSLVTKVESVIGFSRLKELNLTFLDSITRLFMTPETTEATLLLPALESLQITDCPKLEHFWSGIIVAPKLKNVSLSGCDNMEWLFMGSPDRVIELPSLQKMHIRDCQVMKSISYGALTSPKLSDVDIGDCHSMQHVLRVDPNHNGDLQLPFLESVRINDCLNIQSFSIRRVVTPSLTQTVYNGKGYSMLQFEDLNHLLNSINFIDYGEELNLLYGDDNMFH